MLDENVGPAHSRTLFFGAAVLTIGIFCVDLLIPSGVLVPILYVIPIVIAFRAAEEREFLALVLLAATLTGLGVLSPSGGIHWMVYTNRGLALLTIFSLYLVHRMHARTATRLQVLHDLLPQCVSCKKVREDVGYWTRLEFYLEEHHIQQFTNSLCPACEEEYKVELLALKSAKNAPSLPS
jgi:hypothetical protein